MSVPSVDTSQAYVPPVSRPAPVAAPQPEVRVQQTDFAALRADETTKPVETKETRQTDADRVAQQLANRMMEKPVDISIGMVYGSTVSFVKIAEPKDGTIIYTIPQGYEDYARETQQDDAKRRVSYSI
jgi:hypothetical protein